MVDVDGRYRYPGKLTYFYMQSIVNDCQYLILVNNVERGMLTYEYAYLKLVPFY